MNKFSALLILIFFITPILAEEENILREILQMVREGHHDRFELTVRPMDGKLLCKEYKRRLLSNKMDFEPIEKCINETNSAPFRDEDGSCFLLTTKTERPFFVKELPKEECSNATPLNSTSTQLRNISENFQSEYQTTCRHIGLCFKSLNESDYALMEDISKVIKESNFSEMLSVVESEAEQGDISIFSRTNLMRELAELKRSLRTCGEQNYFSTDKQLTAALVLQEDLQKMVKVLPNSTDIYHWFNQVLPRGGLDGEMEEDNILARHYANSLQNNFFSWDFNNGTGFQGRGLYASRLLTSTRNYGDTLLKITLDKGTQYLDLDGGLTGVHIILEDKTINALKAAGCHLDVKVLHPVNAPQVNAVKKFQFSSNSNCRKIFNKVIKSLDIKFMTYDYRRVKSPICDTSDAAFVLIDVDFNEENLKAYSGPIPNYNFPSSKDKKGFQDIPDTLKDDFLISDDRIFRRLSIEEQERLKREKSSRVFNCNQ